jgi:hypothetical protein
MLCLPEKALLYLQFSPGSDYTLAYAFSASDSVNLRLKQKKFAPQVLHFTPDFVILLPSLYCPTPGHVTLLQLLLLCSSSCYSDPAPVTLLHLILLCFSSCYSAPAPITLLQLMLLCSSICYSAPAHVALLQPMLFSLQHICYSAQAHDP